MVEEEETVSTEDPDAENRVSPPEEVEQPARKMSGGEDNSSMNDTRDYLDPGLFENVKRVAVGNLEDSGEVTEKVDPELLARYLETLSDIGQHQLVTGRVIGQNEKEIIMDIGFKSEGIIPRSDFMDQETPSIGDVLDVYLERLEDSSGQTILSKEKADWMKQWNKIVEVFENKETVEGKIVRRIKGGMVVELDGIQAFLPGSQIDVRPVQDFDQYLGQEMEFRVVKLNRLRKNIVLSRKALLEDSLRERREALFNEIQVGQIVEGRVKNITDFGVFIDLGGVDGLLHITDLSWGRVNHPSDMVDVGDKLTVKIIDVDQERQRISLGLKQLTPHPWENISGKYPIGTKVTGKVVSMTNYGAFVEIEKGVEGLVHVSEMSWTRNIRHPSEVVELGDKVESQVLSLDEEERKIALGFRQLQPDPWEGVEQRYPVDSIHKGTVRNLTQFGAFVELEEGIDGLIHISDMSWTKVIRHPKEVVQKGEEVEVKVLDVSSSSRRIGLGLKQTSEDPWSAIAEHFEAGKSITGEVIRSLDKGVIVQLEMDVEGIIPSRSLPRKNRQEILDRFQPGTQVTGEVVRVEPEEKKVVMKIVDIPEASGDGSTEAGDQDEPDSSE